MRHWVTVLFLFFAFVTYGQKFTVSGYVRDMATGENMAGTSVYVKSLQKGTITNAYGFYSMTLPKGKYEITFSFIGYADIIKLVELNKNISLNVKLSESVIVTKEVEVSAQKTDKNIKSTQMSVVQIPVKQIKELPAIFGEVDILKTIQLLPGVQSAGEGTSGYYVRGGGPDQNLIVLDDAVVYNASHLFGFFSVFNADAVKDIKLIKGGMPAKYGGRLSSVLDITMKDGNMEKFKVDGGLGLISSRLTVQGPIKKDTSSFIVSARRTYADLLINPFIKETAKAKGSGYYFYDLNAKVNYRFSDKNRLFISGYYGRDVFSFKDSKAGFNAKIPWGNATTSLRWNHLFNQKLFMNTTLVFTDYKFSFESVQSDFEFKMFSGITDYSGKVDFTYLPSVLHKIQFGAHYVYHNFRPSTVSARMGETEFNFGDVKPQLANDMALYLSDDYEINEKLKIHLGVRPTFFQQIGPFKRYLSDELGNVTDSIVYNNWENVVSYFRLEPRASIRYTIHSKSSVKLSYTQNYQYIHLASLSSVSLPTDLWIPSSTLVRPQYGTQYSAGYFRNFKDNTVETSVEVYYKDMKHQIAFKDGTMPGDNLGKNEDENLTFGDGNSYGAEFFVKKNFGKLTGWIGYTLSKTTKTFPAINRGEPFPAKYDRRHDWSVVTNYKINDKLSLSAVFVYATGNCLTLPIGRYLIDNTIVVEYMPRNSYRMVPYHRMDIALNWEPKRHPEKRCHSSWNFSVYNVYNRKNPYFIYFDTEGTIQQGDLTTAAFQVSLFPILPSITWNFEF